MKLLLLAGALLPQENAAPVRALDPADLAPPAVAEDEAAPEEVPAADPWDGTFAQGMAEVVRLAASDEAADALALTDRLLAPDGYQRWRADLEEDGGVLARAVAAADGPLTWLGLERLPARDRAEVMSSVRSAFA